MKLIKEFKDFIMKGNVVDLAVAVIIGGALGKIVSSLVTDVLMPIIGLFLGGINFTDIKIQLGGAAAVNIGNFMQAIIDFVIIAAVIFVIIKIMSLAKKKTETAAPAVPSPEVVLLTEIRDALKK